MSSPPPHFLVLTYPLQGHIAPALRLARRLLAVAPDVLVTFSTTIPAHTRMFPAKPTTAGECGAAEDDGDGRLEFHPFSDGTERGYAGGGSDVAEFNAYMASFHAAGKRSVGELIDALAARGRPVARVVYTLMLPWAADVARDRGVASALFWIQPVLVLAVYHHYFHGYAGVISEQYRRGDASSSLVELPGLPPLAVGDLPTFLTESAADPGDYFHAVFLTFRDLFDALDRETSTATVLVNSCQELEVGALAAVAPHVDVLPIVPVLPSGGGDDADAGIIKQDDGARYMEWLDAKPANSVVYVSFGSLATMAAEQVEELLAGLVDSGRPYLLVLRKDNRAMLADADAAAAARAKNGMVVEWCDQARVLSHRAVGCFVTHCGWNSVAESVASGVPMVCVPGVSEQSTNARLVERDWRVGVRARVDAGGVLRAAELRRCVEGVMGDDGTPAAAEVRRMAAEWKRVVAEATGKGGSSYRNLVAFVDGARNRT